MQAQIPIYNINESSISTLTHLRDYNLLSGKNSGEMKIRHVHNHEIEVMDPTNIPSGSLLTHGNIFAAA